MCIEKTLSLQLQVADKPANPDADVRATCADSILFKIVVRATCDPAQRLQQEPEDVQFSIGLHTRASGVCMSCAIHA